VERGRVETPKEKIDVIFEKIEKELAEQ